jgi:hypothetical protein
MTIEKHNDKHNPNIHAKDELQALVDLYGKEEMLKYWHSVKVTPTTCMKNIPLILGTKGGDINQIKMKRAQLEQVIFREQKANVESRGRISRNAEWLLKKESPTKEELERALTGIITAVAEIRDTIDNIYQAFKQLD